MKYNKTNIDTSKGFHFFWGHKDVLSQWNHAPFIVEGTEYPNAECWMMAEKARLFNDQDMLKKILETNCPRTVKKMGRRVKRFNHATWDRHKFDVVKQGNFHKFKPRKEVLLATIDKILVEASPYDNVWGIGLRETHPNAKNPTKWLGQNLLGFALMEVRDLLRATP